MKESKFTFSSTDGMIIHYYRWEPESGDIRGVVQIAHGMGEEVSRYRRFAEALTAEGYVVYGNDHRGHGKSAEDLDNQGYLGEGRGFVKLVGDMAHLTSIITGEYPNRPLILFGHSMGSFASQRYIMDYPDRIDGLILCGSNGAQGMALPFGKVVAWVEKKIRGPRGKSKLLNTLSLGRFNDQFEPTRTDFDWISRDEAEVDKYIENPYCGEIFPATFFYEFFDTLQYIQNPGNFPKIPKNLPILILSGSDDPVGDFGKGVENLYDRYKEVGVVDLDMKLYGGARHELLNELNREEVTEDVLEWINRVVTKYENSPYL